MIRIDVEIVKRKLESDWQPWKEKADRATETLLEKWTRDGKVAADDFKSKVWSDLKALLLDEVFHGKVRYCETHMGQSRQPGDADHFRPKGAVNFRTLDDETYVTPTVADENGQETAHPGYFWLAYDWQNLLPACRMCNSDEGKKRQFPVSGRHVFSVELTEDAVANLQDPPLADSRSAGRYFLKSRDLDQIEDPQLLHPYFDKPEVHLRFETGGLVFPKKNELGEESAKGRHSIKVYDLDNEDLRASRQAAQLAAYNLFQATMSYGVQFLGLPPSEAKKRAWAAVSHIKDGKAPYSAAALDFLREV